MRCSLILTVQIETVHLTYISEITCTFHIILEHKNNRLDCPLSGNSAYFVCGIL